MLLDVHERWVFLKESIWTQFVWVMKPRWEEDPRTYLTPALWKGSRLDTSLGSTPERSASGMGSVRQGDVFSSCDANARVSVLGRGSSWTCGRQPTLWTRKDRGVWLGGKCPGELRTAKGLEIQSSVTGILLCATFSKRNWRENKGWQSYPEQVHKPRELMLPLYSWFLQIRGQSQMPNLFSTLHGPWEELQMFLWLILF